MRRIVAYLLLAVVATACAIPGSTAQPAGLAPAPAARPAATPRTVRLPADDAPHDNLTEWWYYTGHLTASTGERYGFELVFFQSRRGDTPVGYAAHFAITDRQRRRFQQADQTHTGPMPAAASAGFDLAIDAWRLQGAGGHDRLQADLPGYAIELDLHPEKPAALHHGIGWVSFGPAGDSYYYSRTRLAVQGTIVDGGIARPVSGTAWFDHQWGDFISVAGGGWDWFAVQLEDRSEVMLSIVRDLDGRTALAYGSLVAPNGEAIHLGAAEFTTRATGAWRSPKTGITYPSGWQVALPRYQLDLTLTPAVLDQELDTRASTGVAYWEGEVDVRGTRDGRPIAGLGYVELTGYER